MIELSKTINVKSVIISEFEKVMNEQPFKIEVAQFLNSSIIIDIILESELEPSTIFKLKDKFCLKLKGNNLCSFFYVFTVNKEPFMLQINSDSNSINHQ